MHVPGSPDQIARRLIAADDRVLPWLRTEFCQILQETLASVLGDFYINGLNNANKAASVLSMTQSRWETVAM